MRSTLNYLPKLSVIRVSEALTKRLNTIEMTLGLPKLSVIRVSEALTKRLNTIEAAGNNLRGAHGW
jgi:hypothetical protein